MSGDGAAASVPKPPDFVRHQVVILMRGPAWTPEKTPAVEELQRQHLAHMRRRMWEAGKLVVAGPFDAAPDPAWRGMCLYAVETPEEARRLAEEDPMVKAGRLRVDVVTWLTERGVMSFAPPPVRGAR